jgi:hypothetical protein
VVLDNADAFFQPNKFPKVVAVWILRGAGTPTQLRGIREINSGNGEIQAIVGSIERFSPESPILKDHPDADKVLSEHRAFTAPAMEAKAIDARLVRDLAPAGTVEGVSVDDCGDWYLFDEDDQVHVRHEVHP